LALRAASRLGPLDRPGRAGRPQERRPGRRGGGL